MNDALQISATAVSVILLRNGARFELTVHEAGRLLTFLRERPALVHEEPIASTEVQS